MFKKAAGPWIGSGSGAERSRKTDFISGRKNHLVFACTSAVAKGVENSKLNSIVSKNQVFSYNYPTICNFAGIWI